MAQLAHHHFGWVGHGFDPGVEHHWWFGPVLFTDVVNVLAHPVARLPRETLVKDIRVHADGSGNATLLFTIRNTGANTIPGYGVDFSVVRP